MRLLSPCSCRQESGFCTSLQIRRGKWGDKSAVYKIWDLTRDADGIHELFHKVSMLRQLQALQVVMLLLLGWPTLSRLTSNLRGRGLAGLMSCSLLAGPACPQAAGDRLHLQWRTGVHCHGRLREAPFRATQLTPQVCSQAMAAVRAVHQLGVLHCDLALHNSLHGSGRVALCDYANAACAAPDDPLLQAEADLASCLHRTPDVA